MNRADIQKPEFFRIIDKRYETKDTFSITIAPPSGRKLSFLPGQFNMLYVFGVGEVPISISGDPHNSESLVHTIKVVGNVTTALERLPKGEMIGVRGPFGNPWPLKECQNRDIVILAGGVGLAPLRSLIYYLIHNRKDFLRIAILYGAREPSEILFYDQLLTWEKQLNAHLQITVDFADESWQGNVGVATNLIRYIPFELKQSKALLCGPEIMFHFCINELMKQKIKEEDIFVAMERNMKCAIGHCGHCQYLSSFICKDGSVLPYAKIRPFLTLKEV